MAAKSMTVDEFRSKIWEHLKDLPDDTEILFGGGDLSFFQCKHGDYRSDGRTPKAIHLEFNELYHVNDDPI